MSRLVHLFLITFDQIAFCDLICPSLRKIASPKIASVRSHLLSRTIVLGNVAKFLISALLGLLRSPDMLTLLQVELASILVSLKGERE